MQRLHHFYVKTLSAILHAGKPQIRRVGLILHRAYHVSRRNPVQRNTIWLAFRLARPHASPQPSWAATVPVQPPPKPAAQ